MGVHDGPEYAIAARLATSTEGTAAIVAKQAIHGLGGIGKSRLAIEYAWRHALDYTVCLFVIADSRENLERNLAVLCDERILNLPARTVEPVSAPATPGFGIVIPSSC